MRAIIFDTETTGFDDPIKIVEAAYIPIDDSFRVTGPSYCQRFNPERPISYGAMATHNIMASDVVSCFPACTFTLPGEVEYLIGHNIDYDWGSIGRPEANASGIPIKRIDTLALCRKHYPDCDSHKQSAMMYYLFGEAAKEMVAGAHSALVDVTNLRFILGSLKSLLGFKNLEELYEMSEAARIPDKITFGKHDGTLIKDLPRDYVSWLLRQDWLDPYLRIALQK